MSPPEAGMDASKRMHEYLLSKQRKQEEFWLRKYGKVLQAPPPSLGRPTGNPRLPQLGGGSPSGAAGGGSSRGSNNGGDASGSLLPPLPGAAAPGPPPPGLPPHRHQQPKGHAPIFHANEPVKDFFSRNARQPRASAVAASRHALGSALPHSHRPPEPYRRAPPATLPPMAGGYAQQQLQQRLPNSEHPSDHQQQHHQQQQHPYKHQHQHQQAQSPRQELGGGYRNDTGDESSYAYQQSQQSPSQRGGYALSPRSGGSGGGAAAHGLPPLPPESSFARSPHSGGGANNGGKPLRNLEMELSVIRAIKAREDVLERLRVAAAKLDSGFGGSAPVVLSPVDPMVRLFYRLVGTLRQRTLDVIEAIAAWRRKVNPSDPFIYFGVDYLAAIGPDVGFLDELPFLRTRLTFGRAADDPFLAEVTPDGIPIEEATTCDLRRGGQRFSSEALRIRMARKVLAHYCGRPLPEGNASSYLLDGGSSAMSGLGGIQSEPSQPRSTRSTASPPAGPAASGELRLALGVGEALAEEEGEEGGGMTTAQIIRALSPPAAPVTSLLPPAVRAITPPAATATAMAAAAAAAGSQAPEAAAAEEASPSQARDEEEEDEEEGVGLARRLLQPEISEAVPQLPEEGDEMRRDEEEPQQAEQLEQAEQPEPEATAAAEEEQAPGLEQEQQEEAAEEVEAEVRAAAAETGQDELEALPEPESAGAGAEPEATAAVEPEAAAADLLDAAADQEPEPQTEQQPEPEQARPDLLVFEDDDDFIDFALGAIIHSLEPPYADAIPTGTFTVAGWEIDCQLDEVVRGIASPERSSRAAARASLMAGATAASREGTPSQMPPRSNSAAPAPPASRGSGRIPQPPAEAKPPSRGRLSDVGAPPPPPVQPRASRIPTPPSAARPPSGGGAAAGGGPTAPRPPVRVHLRPGSSGVDMGLSMDAEEMMTAQTLSGRPSSTGRPSSRPSSRGADGGGGGHVSGPLATAAEILPAISEDRSAFFGDGGAGGDDGEEDPAGATPSGGFGSRPPVRVHLRPTSREVNMTFSMDDDGMLMASPEAAAAPAAGLCTALELEAASALDADADAAAAAVAPPPPPPRLEDMPVPLQGSLSGRSNRASLRLSRQGGGSRPSSAAGTQRGEAQEEA